MNMENSRIVPLLRSGGRAVASREYRPSRRTLRIRLHLALIALDFLCIFLSYLVAGLVYPAGGPYSLATGFMVMPFYFGAAFAARAYSIEIIGHVGRGVARSLQSLAIAVSAVLFVAFYLKATGNVSRAIFAMGFVASVFTLAVGRAFFIRGARAVLGGNPYHVVMISEDRDAVGSLGEDTTILPASRFDPELHCPEMYDKLARALKDADRVIIQCAPERRSAWAHALKGANLQAEILAPELAGVRPIALAGFDGDTTIVVAKGPLSLPDRVVKRAFDLAFAIPALIFAAPLLIIVALAIKIESPGPVFFVQTRIGRGNRQFRMHKFRSMRTETSDGHGETSTRRDDDRITTVGRFIRMCSIDELPQLLDVVIGNMSIVGPRPHALGSRAENKLFWEIDTRYWHRHATKPGLTGLAQVRGFRGATDNQSDLLNRLYADLEYLDRWSIWRDVKILAMTLNVIVHKNAF